MLDFYENRNSDLEWVLEIMKHNISYFMNKSTEAQCDQIICIKMKQLISKNDTDV